MAIALSWLHPEYAPALGLLLLALLGLAWEGYVRQRLMRQMGDPLLVARMVPEIRRRWWIRRLFWTAALGGFLLALLGPRYGLQKKEVRREGLDLVIALDVSYSMQAEDVPPSRLGRARYEIARLLEALEGDRVGLVLFAGDALLQCPLTRDYNAVRLFLEVADPGHMPAQGTDFRAAFRAARQAFAHAGDDPTRTRVLLLVSDGEHHEGDVEALARDIREAGMVVLAAGVGEPRPVPIPQYREGRRVGYKEDAGGRVVYTRLVARDLQALAREGGYVHLGKTSGSLRDLLPVLEGLQRTVEATEVYETYAEQYQWPLLLALLLLLGGELMTLKPVRRSHAAV